PRNVPVRTASGVAILTAFFILVLAGSNDLLATHFQMSLNDITWTFRVLLFVGPVVAFWITKRICLGLQRRDRDLVLHGHESATIDRLEHGEYIEIHKPHDEHELWLRVNYEARRPVEIEPAEDSRGVRRKGYRADRIRRRISQFFYEDRIEPVPAEEPAAAPAQAPGQHAHLDRSGKHAPTLLAGGHGAVGY